MISTSQIFKFACNKYWNAKQQIQNNKFDKSVIDKQISVALTQHQAWRLQSSQVQLMLIIVIIHECVFCISTFTILDTFQHRKASLSCQLLTYHRISKWFHKELCWNYCWRNDISTVHKYYWFSVDKYKSRKGKIFSASFLSSWVDVFLLCLLFQEGNFSGNDVANDG